MGYGPMEDYITSRSHTTDNVFFREAVRPEDILRYTSSADVGLSVIEPISLSYEYCMPNKLFEYLNAGLPVITSPTKEQKLFVEENRVGMVSEDYSPESIEKVVDYIAKNKDEYIESVRKASLTYNWHQESKKIESIYRKVLGILK
jgi:glycosyltransferase involved in cell wall biosynthesis